jgi:quinol monooxygenase YgiN
MGRSSYAALSLGCCTLLAIVTLIAKPTSAQPGAQPGRGGGPDMGAALAQGLNETEGCLKVAFAQTSQGTNTIMAWFEDKAAAKRWYYSETHTRFMKMAGQDPAENEPMVNVPEDVPVFVMASIKMSKDGSSVLPGPMPVEQIAIELYTPLDAGASVNGRLMPDEIELPNFEKLDTGARGE